MQQQPQRCLQTLPLRQLLRRRQQDRAAAVMAAAAAVVAAAWWAHLRLCYQRWQNQQPGLLAMAKKTLPAARATAKSSCPPLPMLRQPASIWRLRRAPGWPDCHRLGRQGRQGQHSQLAWCLTQKSRRCLARSHLGRAPSRRSHWQPLHQPVSQLTALHSMHSSRHHSSTVCSRSPQLAPQLPLRRRLQEHRPPKVRRAKPAKASLAAAV